MELEHGVKIFPIDEDLQKKVAELVEEGWELVPGLKPQAIYHVVRMKKAPEGVDATMAKGPAGVGIMQIDDSKVHVIPAKKDMQ